MKVLIVNCGSSSLKYQLINTQGNQLLAKGLVERIGLDGAVLTHQPEGQEKVVTKQDIRDHQVAIQLVLGSLTDARHGVVKSLQEIDGVGHRVVHGGEAFSSSVIIDEKVMAALDECSEMAPLHNPPNIIGIKACQKLLPGVPQVAVFDTAFHQSMPDYEYLYGLPYELYEKHRIRRYGFHGTSHKYVSQRAAAMLGKPLEETRIITCHLGNGASLAAVKGGKSVATSMGLTPLEGLMMGTRSGDIDPAIIEFVMDKENLTIKQVTDLLNKKSGVLGVSGISSDFRDLENAAAKGNKRAQLAIDMFDYNVKKYIGSYIAVLGGADAIVFTAGLGENSAPNRAAICSGLEFLGVRLDAEKNKLRGKEMDISAEGATIKVLVIPTNEELMIAMDTNQLLEGK